MAARYWTGYRMAWHNAVNAAPMSATLSCWAASPPSNVCVSVIDTPHSAARVSSISRRCRCPCHPGTMTARVSVELVISSPSFSGRRIKPLPTLPGTPGSDEAGEHRLDIAQCLLGADAASPGAVKCGHRRGATVGAPRSAAARCAPNREPFDGANRVGQDEVQMRVLVVLGRSISRTSTCGMSSRISSSASRHSETTASTSSGGSRSTPMPPSSTCRHAGGPRRCRSGSRGS